MVKFEESTEAEGSDSSLQNAGSRSGSGSVDNGAPHNRSSRQRELLRINGVAFYEKAASADLLLPNYYGTNGEDRKMRRQIANCNERRRMQSINAGFQTLRQLLPPRRQGDKLSKAAILQQTADFIQKLSEEKNRLVEENNAKRRRLDEQGKLEASAAEHLKIIDELRATLNNEKQLRHFYEASFAEMKEKLKTKVADDFTCQLVPNAQLNNNMQLIVAALIDQQQNMNPHLHVSSNTPADISKSHFSPTHPIFLPILHQQTPNIFSTITSLQTPVMHQQNSANGLGEHVILHDANAKSHSAAGPHQQFENNRHLLSTNPPPPAGVQQNALNGASLEQQMLGSSTPTLGSPSVSQRNLQAILEAIRHLEGDASPILHKSDIESGDLLVR